MRDRQAKAHIERRTRAISVLTVVILLVIMIQLWLITIALEEYLAARNALAVGTFLASGACFLLNAGLLKYLYDLDRGKN